jgi:hypothetical protein
MTYTSYFSNVLKSSGTPHLDTDEFAKYMNVVHLEGKIAALQELINKEKQIDKANIYRLKVDAIQMKISKLTDSLEPKDFLTTLIQGTL